MSDLINTNYSSSSTFFLDVRKNKVHTNISSEFFKGKEKGGRVRLSYAWDQNYDGSAGKQQSYSRSPACPLTIPFPRERAFAPSASSSESRHSQLHHLGVVGNRMLSLPVAEVARAGGHVPAALGLLREPLHACLHLLISQPRLDVGKPFLLPPWLSFQKEEGCAFGGPGGYATHKVMGHVCYSLPYPILSSSRGGEQIDFLGHPSCSGKKNTTTQTKQAVSKSLVPFDSDTVFLCFFSRMAFSQRPYSLVANAMGQYHSRHP